MSLCRCYLFNEYFCFNGVDVLWIQIFKVYQNLITMSPFLSFLPSPFYHVKTHLWMIMVECRIVMV
jgi:hypothetical protein